MLCIADRQSDRCALEHMLWQDGWLELHWEERHQNITHIPNHCIRHERKGTQIPHPQPRHTPVQVNRSLMLSPITPQNASDPSAESSPRRCAAGLVGRWPTSSCSPRRPGPFSPPLHVRQPAASSLHATRPSPSFTPHTPCGSPADRGRACRLTCSLFGPHDGSRVLFCSGELGTGELDSEREYSYMYMCISI